VGGALGLLLATGGLWVSSRALASTLGREGFFHLDVQMVAAAVFLSLVVGLIAGLYPAWRICNLPPAQHLKTQ
jgi:putative ABC transport system permease protein